MNLDEAKKVAGEFRRQAREHAENYVRQVDRLADLLVEEAEESDQR